MLAPPPLLRSVASSTALLVRRASLGGGCAGGALSGSAAAALAPLPLLRPSRSASLVAHAAMSAQTQLHGDAPMATDADPAAIPLPGAAAASKAAPAPPPPPAFSAASSTAGPTLAAAPSFADALAAAAAAMAEDDNAVTSPPAADPVAAIAAAAPLPPPPLFFATAPAPGVGAHIAIGGHRGMGMNVLLDAAAALASATAQLDGPFEFAATSAAAGSAAPSVAAAAALGLAPTPAAAAAAAAAAALPPSAPTAGTFTIAPAWRENTVASMRAAHRAGASFVEFDVQVTADGHAVLWHDDSVEYGDPAAPQRAAVGELTLAEFRALGHLTAGGMGDRLSVVRAFWTHAAAGGGGGSSGSEGDAAAAAALGGASPRTPVAPPPLALGVEDATAAAAASPPAAARGLWPPPASSAAAAAAAQALAPAVPASSGDSSGSAVVGAAPARFKSPHRRWRCRHEEPFPSLDEVFASLPPSVAFNIEVKMATPASLARTPAEEVERVVGPVVATVERCLAAERAGGGGGGSALAPLPPPGPRSVVFSSFDPDVCAALRARAPSHPVCLLSTGATEAHADPRRTCLAQAVAFAAGAGLAGVVADSTALAARPRTVAEARAAGLAVMTYGGANGDARWVAAQAALGVHAAIVDDVEGVLRGLSAGAGATM